ncbi:MAG: C_GCAxxG_C_C family protein [Solobacterium sp.]|nr:C_GCAxxG_C_C family protein [Solobacterium sp.]
MSKKSEKAAELRKQFRENGMPKYNCAQTCAMAFAKDLNMDEKQLEALTVHFGGGMKMGSVCGAYTSGLMVMGLLGLDDNASRNAFMNGMKAKHENLTDCKDLLKRNAEKGGDKMTHCNRMIFDAIELIEEIQKTKTA